MHMDASCQCMEVLYIALVGGMIQGVGGSGSSPHAQAVLAGVGQDEALGPEAAGGRDDVAHARHWLLPHLEKVLHPLQHARQHRVRAAWEQATTLQLQLPSVE